MMRAGCPPLLRRLDHAVDQYTLGEIEAERGLYESVAGLAMSTRLSMQVMRASKMYVNFSHAWFLNYAKPVHVQKMLDVQQEVLMEDMRQKETDPSVWNPTSSLLKVGRVLLRPLVMSGADDPDWRFMKRKQAEQDAELLSKVRIDVMTDPEDQQLLDQLPTGAFPYNP